ncbi:MAG: phosphatidate cytidylyltransferase [Deltaproteobacteria bacterium]|nr:phosphatidate cytidylyltransferase [Deltaproteobacteria bacterium]
MSESAAQDPQPVAGAAPRQRTNLQERLITAGILVPLVCGVVALGGWWLLLMILVITAIAINEFYHLIEAKGAVPVRGVGTAAALALPLVAYIGSEYLATVLLSAVLLGLMIAQLRKKQISESLASISETFFGVFYVGWLLSHAIVLREFKMSVAGRWGGAVAREMHDDVGGFYLFFVIAVVIFGDIGAYFTGRKYGQRKLAPEVSPNKTIEGAYGAIAAGIAMAALLKAGFDWVAPELSEELSWLAVLLIAPVLAVVGIVGDLVESLLKRDAQVKDTGTLLPGTGGVLDRIDSNLLGIPVMYYFLLAYTYFNSVSPRIAP